MTTDNNPENDRMDKASDVFMLLVLAAILTFVGALFYNSATTRSESTTGCEAAGGRPLPTRGHIYCLDPSVFVTPKE